MTDTVRIFLVEDHAVMRSSLTALLERESDFIVCATAESAEDALRLLDELDADLVLVDVSLPGASGLALIGAVRERRPELGCIALSGYDAATYEPLARKSGALAYIPKYRVREIIPTIRQALNSPAA
jgi:DNA-binding NarL/FixJ family response regulator